MTSGPNQWGFGPLAFLYIVLAMIKYPCRHNPGISF